MSEFNPYYTADGSVGLYSNDFNDIYHSSDGALTEAYEKFIYPVDFNNLLKKDKIKVLDICYGIGYNTKSFLNFIFDKYISKKKLKIYHSCKKDSEAIYTDNNYRLKAKKNISAIYTNNIFERISIHAIDNDENLCMISPFIKTGQKNIRNQKISFDDKNKIKKYLKNNNKKVKINKIINFLIFYKIYNNISKSSAGTHLSNILSNKKYEKYFDRELLGVFRHFNYYSCIKQKKSSININLHNIYYKYISIWYKWMIKHYKLQDLSFKYSHDDARKIIKNDNNTYNLIFLDAFTPSKCPCLWSLEFFKELYKHMEEDGILLTYSSSASVRSAMINAGFFIGNIYNNRLNKFTGTFCAKKESLIKYPLSEDDLGLLNTTAGIFYRDKNLNTSNEAIIAAREVEVKNSNKITTSSYKKQIKKKI